MALGEIFSSLVKDRTPEYVFELSEAGIAYSRPGGQGPETGFLPFEAGTLVASPTEDNVRRADQVAMALARLSPAAANKRRPAAVILPDYAARVSVLDFDSFPSSAEEQLSLVRFRLKKAVPFDIDAAAVSYFVQGTPEKKARGKIEVVAVAVALEIIARYEALFRAANFHPGEVTTSALAALNLDRGEAGSASAVIAKLSGRVLTVMVVHAGALKLFRCVELEDAREDEILAVLHPTLAYVEDELGSPSARLILCGFPAGSLAGLNRPHASLESSRGTPGATNAGLFGYLEGARN